MWQGRLELVFISLCTVLCKMHSEKNKLTSAPAECFNQINPIENIKIVFLETFLNIHWANTERKDKKRWLQKVLTVRVSPSPYGALPLSETLPIWLKLRFNSIRVSISLNLNAALASPLYCRSRQAIRYTDLLLYAQDDTSIKIILHGEHVNIQLNKGIYLQIYHLVHTLLTLWAQMSFQRLVDLNWMDLPTNVNSK